MKQNTWQMSGLLLGLMMAVALAACGGSDRNDGPAVSGALAPAPAPAPTPGPAPAPAPAPVPPAVASCAPTGAVGAWENITPRTTLRGFGVSSVIVSDPTRPATLYISVDSQGIFKTTDCGANWARIDNPASGFDGGPGNTSNSSIYAWTMAIDPTNPQVLYANNGYGKMGVFKSVNGGIDWKASFVTPQIQSVFVNGGFTNRVVMDPTNPMHLTVTPHFTCVSPHSENCLLETFNGGADWRVIENGAPSGEGAGQSMIDSAHWLWSVPDPRGTVRAGLFRTADSGKNWEPVPGIDSAWAGIYRSPKGAFYLGSNGGILRSTDGWSWSKVADLGNNGPKANSITGDGTRLYSSFGFAGFGPEYSTATEDNPTVWKPLVGPPAYVNGPGSLNQGAWGLFADPVNHFLYSSNGSGGFWRMRTQ